MCIRDSPRGDQPIPAGELIEFLTLVCPCQPKEIKRHVERFVEREGQTVLRPMDAKVHRQGDCVALKDRLDTSRMTPGSYTYRVRWDPGSDLETVTTERRFEVIEGASGVAAK